MIQGLRAPGFRLEKLAVWGFAGSLALGAGLAHHAAQAAIFADDEARKAILDLRIRFEESRNQLQEQTKQIQNLSAQIQKLGAQIQAFDAELKDTQQSVQKKSGRPRSAWRAVRYGTPAPGIGSCTWPDRRPGQ